MADKQSYTYAGVHECGGWLAVMVDCEDTKPDQAKELSRWIRYGLTINRVPTEDINTEKLPLCKCDLPKGKKGRK